MYKNILFLLFGYWGMYYITTLIPGINIDDKNKMFVDLIMNPEFVLKFSAGFLIGLIGYSITVATIFENIYSVLKLTKKQTIESTLHILAFLFSYFVLFLEWKMLFSFGLLFILLFGGRTFIVRKGKIENLHTE